MSNPDVERTDAFLLDLAKRAGSTAYQTALATIATMYVAGAFSSLSLSDVANDKKVLFAAAAAVGAAVLSAVKSSVLTYLRLHKAQGAALADADAAAVLKNMGVEAAAA